MLHAALTVLIALVTVLCVRLAELGLRRDTAGDSDDTPPWLARLSQTLDSTSAVKRGLTIIVTLLCPAVFTLLAFGESFGLTKREVVTVGILFFITAILIGILLLIGERSSGELARLLGLAEVGLENERRRSAELTKAIQEQRTEARDELDRELALSFVRGRLSYRINQVLIARGLNTGTINIKNTLALLLNEIGEVGDELFQWLKSEKWSLAFYLWNSDTAKLECATSMRPNNIDFGEEHRSWRSGEGMVGITFLRGRRLVISDAKRSELEAVMADHDDETAKRDRDVYRSVAAHPIFKPVALADEGALPSGMGTPNPPNRLYGVVVATSDQRGRFKATGDAVSLNALAALSQAASSVLMAAELRMV